MLKYGLADCARNIRPIKFEMENKDRIELWIENITVSKPRVPQTAIKVRTKAMYPSECRQRAISYKGMCDVRMGWRVNGQKMPSIDKELGEVPIMLQVSIVSRGQKRRRGNNLKCFFISNPKPFSRTLAI